MRALPLAFAAAAAVLSAACGQATGRPPGHPGPPMTPVRVSRARVPRITGGTAAQRALLGAIVRAQGATQIDRLAISPAGRAWRPDRPTDVLLTAKLAGDPGHARHNTVGDWETWVVGGAFRARSAALGLPRVLVVSDDAGADKITGGSDPPARPASGLPAFRSRVRAIADGSGARVVAIRAGDPDGYTALVALQAPDPVEFLRHHLDRLTDRLAGLHADGTLILVYERSGRILYAAGSATRVPLELGGSGDPRYAPCVPPPAMTPLASGPAPPLPCPSTRRPPPSTPPTPPKLGSGDELAGAVAAGGSGHGGSMVPYVPGTSGAVQLVIENPNGHAITIESIAPAVAAGLPIRFTGVRIQVPRSRADAGAAMVRKPYGPEPPMRPVTIRPGDWIGVGLHFAVVRACTAGLAGRVIAADRTLVVTYVLRGRTLRHTLPGVRLNLVCPR